MHGLSGKSGYNLNDDNSLFVTQCLKPKAFLFDGDDGQSLDLEVFNVIQYEFGHIHTGVVPALINATEVLSAVHPGVCAWHYPLYL